MGTEEDIFIRYHGLNGFGELEQPFFLTVIHEAGGLKAVKVAQHSQGFFLCLTIYRCKRPALFPQKPDRRTHQRLDSNASPQQLPFNLHAPGPKILCVPGRDLLF